MGLDMMLYKKRKKDKINDWNDWEEVSNKLKEIGYWRKANQVHKYFVDECNDGNDDNCAYYEVSKDVIEKLNFKCKEILDDVELIDDYVLQNYSYDKNEDGETIKKERYVPGKVIKDTSICEEQLPTQSGFFFGSTEYNECYYEQIKYTYDLTQNILNIFDFENNDLYYEASW